MALSHRVGRGEGRIMMKLRSDTLPVWPLAVAAITFPVVYLASDVIEIVQGDFSTFRLSLTYVGEAGFPLFVIGLLAVQHRRIGRWGAVGAIAYAYSFVFFSSTVVWAIVAGTATWEALGDDFGWWITVHGAVMVFGGIAFGFGVVEAGVFPRWTGYALAIGVVLVAAASGSGNLERALASALPDAAFVAMGIHLLRRTPSEDDGAAQPPTRQSRISGRSSMFSST